jgi:UDP-glucose 4-epimerase
MTEQRAVLVTGVAGTIGRGVAEALTAKPGIHVIGLDSDPPEDTLKDLDFIRADVRNPLIVDLMKSEGIDTVCHLKFVESDRPSEATFDINVMGTMKVFGACEEAGVRKFVIMSSTEVYGAKPDNSAFLLEEHPLSGSTSSGTIRDLVEIEAICDGFARQTPQIGLTILRFANIIGARIDAPLTRYLKEPTVPVLLGFDPMMQVIHEDDVVRAIIHAVINDVPGIYNVAGEGVLPLTKLVRLAGKFPVPIPHWLAYWGQGFLGRRGQSTPFEPDYLRYPWVGDLTKMRTKMQFEPHYTSEEALREFAGVMRVSRYKPESAALQYDEDRLRDTIERRRRIRETVTDAVGEKAEGFSHE